MDDFDRDEGTDLFWEFMSQCGEGFRLKTLHPGNIKHCASHRLSLEAEVFGLSLFFSLSCLAHTLPQE